MDILSLIGIIIGFGAILGGNIMEGGHLESLINGPAFVIVVGGTVGAAMLQTSLSTFGFALKSLAKVFIPPKANSVKNTQKVIEWSSIARREGLLGLEALVDDEKDPFAQKGLQLLVDGGEPEVIREVLDVDLYSEEIKGMAAAKVFEGMGGYSPTIGIIGAVMGLIHVMQNLSDPSMLGSGIATAFVATIYGVGLANLLFLPIANKLKAQVAYMSRSREMIMEGITAIAEGENPRNIEIKLQGFFK